MRPAVKIFLAALFVFSAHTVWAADGLATNIIPAPQSMARKAGQFIFKPGATIILGDGLKRGQFVARQINDEIALLGHKELSVVLEKNIRSLPAGFIFIGNPESKLGHKLLRERKGEMKPSMKDEGYFLDVDGNGIVIIGESEKGQFYGVMTLLQLIRRQGDGMIVDGVTISDFPLYPVRGITDDIARGQVSTVDNFKKIIRFLARYKINTYGLYLEDMFVFKDHPLIGKGRGALTPQEVKEIDSYARQYYIDLVPIFQTLGHWENILSIPQYLSYAEYPGGRTVNVSDDKVYALLDEMIGELSSSFSSQYFNMGGDEARDVGLRANRARVAKEGLASVLAAHYNRVADIIRKYGKIPMVYDDMILKNPDILRLLSKDIIVVDWDYDPRFTYETPSVIRNAGFPLFVSTAVWSYPGPFPDYLNSFANIQRFGRAGYEAGASGVWTSSWNDFGGEELRELNYYGYAWAAECAWAPLKPSAAAFDDIFFQDFFGTSDVDAFRSAYDILSSPANRYTWSELWRHPMLPFLPPRPQKGHSPVIMDRLESITSSMPFVLSLLKRSEHLAVRNEDHLKYLEFVAQLNLWFAKKVEVEEEVRRMSMAAGTSTNKDSLGREIVSRCSEVISDLQKLKSEFKDLWLTTNKPEGLEYLMARYDQQAAYWQEKIDEVKQGNFWVDPELESAWIYGAASHAPAADSERVPHIYFRKTFFGSKKIRSATLQLIGDTYVNVWVNGREAAEVYVRRSNSLSAEHQRIKVVDILPFLTDSANVITADAQNFITPNSAGVNIYCELKFSDGSVKKIMSDSTWKTADVEYQGWMAVSFDDSSWPNAMTKVYPYTIIRPNFATGRSSWIER
ncbi:MAG TPA: glycoside hydrolase family 20 zincin-like fold domain-containing protein [Bacteroidota bacterium]|nr:glycoside hydrolase family 20 zincin-like fold domain-containing protein [Bacteroidota bacterium]